MKRIIRHGLIVLTGLVFLAGAAEAQLFPSLPPVGGAATERPPLTPPDYIAMTFFKLAGQPPDFAAWTQNAPALKNATSFNRDVIQQEAIKRLKESFSLLSTRDPIVMETDVKLSAYDMKNRGFFIQNFKISTFFPAHYLDRSYAVVPQGLVDKQWMSVEDPSVAATIESAARASGRLLKMTVFLIPKYVDAKTPTSIGGEAYWPIVASVQKMVLYAPSSNMILWQSLNGGAIVNETHQGILNLYK